MARPRICRSSRRNPPLGGEDGLTKGPPKAPIKDSNTPTPFLPVSWAQTPISAQAPAPPSNKGLFQ